MPQVLDDRFQLVSKFPGVGANNNAIFLATDINTSKQVVLKRLLSDDCGREAEVHTRLANHPNIVQMVEYGLPSPFMMAPVVIGHTDWEKDFYVNSKFYGRLYLEACTVVVDSEKWHTLKDIRWTYIMRRANLPELFIWSLYADLLKALCFMWFGVRDVMTDDSPVAGREPIIHRDIHMGNVFLASPLPCNKVPLAPSTEPQSPEAIKPVPGYPRVLLGDFGNSSSYGEFIHQMGRHLNIRDTSWDLWQLRALMDDLCCDDNHEWKGYSQELSDIFEPLNNMRRKMKLDEGLLYYTKVVIRKIEELKEKGKLIFVPL